MTKFTFDGNWEFEYQFDAFKGLQSRRGAYTSSDAQNESDGTVKVVIRDELNDEPDPSTEQLNALDYIIKYPAQIRQALFKALETEYPALMEQYKSAYDDKQVKERLPDIKSLREFSKVFGVGCIFVYLPQKDGHAYIGLECGCTWDEEHGLGFLLNKDRLIKIGGAEVAFDSWQEPLIDNGTYQKEREKLNRPAGSKRQLPKPKIYQPHPKYGKLKPSQVEANKMYENRLIELGYDQEFIDLVESGQIDININKAPRTGYSQITYLERAARSNNVEIASYILSKNPKSTENVIKWAGRHASKPLVLLLTEYGIDVNDRADGRSSVLAATERRIAFSRGKKDIDELNKFLEFADWLKQQGAK